MLSSLLNQMGLGDLTKPSTKATVAKAKKREGKSTKKTGIADQVVDTFVHLKDKVEQKLPITYHRTAGTMVNSNLCVGGNLTVGLLNSDCGSLPSATNVEYINSLDGLIVNQGGITVNAGGLSTNQLTVTGATALQGGIDVGGTTITSVATPVNSTDAANKAYVDLVLPNKLTAGSFLQADVNGKVSSSTSLSLNSSGTIVAASGASFSGQVSASAGLAVSGGVLTASSGASISGGVLIALGGLNVSGGIATAAAGLNVTGAPLNASNGANVTGGLNVDTLKVSGLTANSIVSTDSKSNLISTSFSGSLVDTGSAQIITGQKTFTSPILNSPIIYDANGNISSGMAKFVLLAATTTDQLVYQFTNLNLSASTFSCFIFDFSLIVNDATMSNGIYNISYNTGTFVGPNPIVLITDLTGTGAAATATADSNGKLTAVTITATGKNYSANPVILIAPLVNISAKASVGNVFACQKYIAAWNVSASSPDSSTATGILQNSQVGVGPCGFSLYTKFTKSGPGGKPAIGIYINTGGYVNPVNVALKYSVTSTAPN